MNSVSVRMWSFETRGKTEVLISLFIVAFCHGFAPSNCLLPTLAFDAHCSMQHYSTGFLIKRLSTLCM